MKYLTEKSLKILNSLSISNTDLKIIFSDIRIRNLMDIKNK